MNLANKKLVNSTSRTFSFLKGQGSVIIRSGRNANSLPVIFFIRAIQNTTLHNYNHTTYQHSNPLDHVSSADPAPPSGSISTRSPTPPTIRSMSSRRPQRCSPSITLSLPRPLLARRCRFRNAPLSRSPQLRRRRVQNAQQHRRVVPVYVARPFALSFVRRHLVWMYKPKPVACLLRPSSSPCLMTLLRRHRLTTFANRSHPKKKQRRDVPVPCWV